MGEPHQFGVSHLRRLVALADHGSVAAAARALQVPVANIDGLLWRLRAQSGGPLFESTPTGLVPTYRGARIVDAARRALADLALLEGEVRASTQPGLRLMGCDGLLPPVVAALARTRPSVAVISSRCTVQDAVDAVRIGDADLAVVVRRPGPAAALPREVARRDIGSLAPGLLVARTHRLAGTDVIDLQDVADEPWCVRDDADALLAEECGRQGFAPQVRYRLAGDDEVLGVVATGAAVALAEGLGDGNEGVVRLPVRRVRPGRVTLLWSPEVDADMIEDVAAALTARVDRRLEDRVRTGAAG